MTLPPRHGKSELCAIRYPCWYLGRNPDKRVVLASYAADLAQRFSRLARTVIQSESYQRVFEGIGLAQDSRSAENWDLAGYRGGMKSVGVGGPLTGHGANLLIIDDPVKNREEANSEVVRQSVWDWYTSTAYTRLEENAAVVVVMTRWHEADLMGRLIEAQKVPGGDQWTILHMPALSEAGEALWPDKYTVEDLERIRSNIGEYDWNALYQGAPRPREGAMFKRHWFQPVDSVPDGARRVRYWDKAGTEGGGAFTAGILLAEVSGRFYVEDAIRGQWSAGERERVIRATAERDGREVDVWIEQEPGSGGKESAEATVRNLAGFVARAETVTGDKETRARPYAAQCEAGNVNIVKGDWNPAYVEEHCSFPFGRFKDQVDGSSGAFNKLARPRSGIRQLSGGGVVR